MYKNEKEFEKHFGENPKTHQWEYMGKEYTHPDFKNKTAHQEKAIKGKVSEYKTKAYSINSKSGKKTYHEGVSKPMTKEEYKKNSELAKGAGFHIFK